MTTARETGKNSATSPQSSFRIMLNVHLYKSSFILATAVYASDNKWFLFTVNGKRHLAVFWFDKFILA